MWIDLINNIACILDEPLVLHSNLVCNPCFRRVELLSIEETVLKAGSQRTGQGAITVHNHKPRTKRLSS